MELALSHHHVFFTYMTTQQFGPIQYQVLVLASPCEWMEVECKS